MRNVLSSRSGASNHMAIFHNFHPMKEALQLRGMLGSFLDFCVWAHTYIYVLSIIRVAQNIKGHPRMSVTWIVTDVVLGIMERTHTRVISQAFHAEITGRTEL